MKSTPTLTIVMSVICILIYAAFLQFHAATASVGEDFLPGIGTARTSPGPQTCPRY